jgi:predicted acylesterase/phospholipase RssA
MLTGTVIQGGGARGGGVFGALQMGDMLGKWRQPAQDFFAGTSFGAFAATGLAMGMTPGKLADLYINTNFRPMLDNWLLAMVPWSLRKNALLAIQGDMKRLADFYDKLADEYKWTPEKAGDRLIINTVDLARNKQIILCEKRPEWLIDRPNVIVSERVFSTHGFGAPLCASQALPGLKCPWGFQYGDGGASIDNGPMSYMPRDARIYYINMGYAGDVDHGKGRTFPTSAVERAFYFFDFKADDAKDFVLEQFSNVRFIDCGLYDMSGLEMDATPARKRWAVEVSAARSRPNWQLLN